MAGIADSIRIKIERANHHIADLEICVSQFLSSGPYKAIGEMDAEGRAAYRLSGVQPVPLIIPSIAGDAIQNLRTALDYLACALWSRRNFGECKNPISFPISDDAQKLESEGLRKIKAIAQDAIDLISGIEPFRGGKADILWRLHHLSIIDKHRLPLAVVGGNLGIHLPSFSPGLVTE